MTASQCLALVPAQGTFVEERFFCTSNASLHAYDEFFYLVCEVMRASSILRLSDESQLTQGSGARFGGLH